MNTPFFSEWPPVQGNDVEYLRRARHRIWPGWGVTGWLLVLGLLGVGVLLLGKRFEWFFGSWRVVWDGVGIGIITASALGVTVDRFLKQEILEEVFKAAFGYVLPEQLKPAARWIYGQKLIYENFTALYEFSECSGNPDALILTVEINRTLRNVTKHNEDATLGLNVDDYGIAPCVKILEFGYRPEGGDGKLITEHEDSARGPKLKPVQVTIPAESYIVNWFKYRTVMHRNDGLHLTVRYAITEPKIRVTSQIPIEIDPPTFATPEEFKAVPEGKNWWRLPATLFPDHTIELRWRPEENRDAKRNETPNQA